MPAKHKPATVSSPTGEPALPTEKRRAERAERERAARTDKKEAEAWLVAAAERFFASCVSSPSARQPRKGSFDPKTGDRPMSVVSTEAGVRVTTKGTLTMNTEGVRFVSSDMETEFAFTSLAMFDRHVFAMSKPFLFDVPSGQVAGHKRWASKLLRRWGLSTEHWYEFDASVTVPPIADALRRAAVAVRNAAR